MREEWSRMSRDERADFIEDWPINNDILMDLEDYVAKHDLSEEQKAQWTGLRGLVGSQAQTLQDMGYRVVVTKESKQRAVA
ncbi:MAG: hypothetical protein M1587_02995 [Thaumarchaeota archaeon]|nr:hypothetical protein [Nitrososphaerota archaeon]